MTNLHETLADLGFPNVQHNVMGRNSIANLIQIGERCGIYVLCFADGEIYAGQAIDVARRYTQHRKNYDDIDKISFKCVAPNKLNTEERQVIHKLEKAGFHLRNNIHTSVSYSRSPFDEIMSPEEQKKWVNDIQYVDVSGERIDNPDLRRKYRKKYQRFVQMPFADEFTTVLREYVRRCIPAFVQSEMYYWCCSCLLHRKPGDVMIYSRINIYQQEVFTVGTEKGVPFLTCHLANSPLRVSWKKYHFYRPDLYEALLQSNISLINHQYKPGGQDQVQMYIEGLENVLNVFHNPYIIEAIRLFNLRLMRKGANWYYRYHCFDLADRLLEFSAP